MPPIKAVYLLFISKITSQTVICEKVRFYFAFVGQVTGASKPGLNA